MKMRQTLARTDTSLAYIHGAEEPPHTHTTTTHTHSTAPWTAVCPRRPPGVKPQTQVNYTYRRTLRALARYPGINICTVV